jgi:MFS family permease
MLINRDFGRLWFGQAVSLVGDYVFDTTLVLWVAVVLMPGEAYAPAVSSGVLIVAALAAVLVAPFAGVLVDRWDKRRTMLHADLIRFALVGSLAAVTCLPDGLIPVPALIALAGIVVAVATATAGFFNPARIVLIGDVVPPERFGQASGLMQATMAGAAIIGPPLAAPLLLGVGVQWALALNAASFLVSYLLLRSVRSGPPPPADTAPPAEPAGMRQEFAAGLSLFRASRMLVTLLVTSTLVMLGAGAVNALDVYFVAENLRAGPHWFGVLGAALGGGALTGALLAGVVGDRLGHAKVFCGGLLLAAGLFVVYAHMTAAVPAVIVAALFSVGLGGIGAVTMPLILGSVPRAYLGRVMAVLGPVSQVASIVSIGVAGSAVALFPVGFRTTVLGVGFGRIDLIFSASAVLMLCGAAYAVATIWRTPGPLNTGSIPPASTVVDKNSQGASK